MRYLRVDEMDVEFELYCTNRAQPLSLEKVAESNRYVDDVTNIARQFFFSGLETAEFLLLKDTG